MYTFFISLFLLLTGFLIYSKVAEKTFCPDNRETPAVRMNDGVDYIPMPQWKVFLIQLLNIAGTGPVFGALSGAIFGPVVYIWIVFGCIFAGAVHDYMCGMISVRNNGASVSEIAGKYLGNGMRYFMRVFSLVLLIMCGVVFTTGPADLLAMLTPKSLNARFWLWVVTVYYLVATFVSIDKIIGKIYPLFGACLIFMALGVVFSLLLSDRFVMPELWNNFENQHAEGIPVWPFMFVTVACGAISGFHATQTPMMARCIKTEKQGRTVFYGAMIAEGVIALIWAAAGVTYYEDSQALLAAGGGCSAVVYNICRTSMGKLGALLAMVGVIVCPITSGDTAYRSARLIIADWFKLDQKNWKKRLLVTIPILGVGVIVSHMDYSTVWRCFSWSNQSLATISLWAAVIYLRQNGRNRTVAIIPAIFMGAVTMTYFVAAPEWLGYWWEKMNVKFDTYYIIALIAGVLFAVATLLVYKRNTGD
ncbi:MAG: carbon starvation protein A [Sphaerochaetaceae bacterium]|nr:carbon starvation protein A [Sphaerochaetaceae bacterium]